MRIAIPIVIIISIREGCRTGLSRIGMGSFVYIIYYWIAGSFPFEDVPESLTRTIGTLRTSAVQPKLARHNFFTFT